MVMLPFDILDQNLFFGSSKRYSLENDFNGMVLIFTLENIFNEKYGYLELFISRINVIIGQTAIKPIKKSMSEKRVMRKKNITTR